MDSSAVKVSMTADDFDSILSYVPDQASWTTPDPWSADVDLETTPWWHRTEQVDAPVSLNFTGAFAFCQMKWCLLPPRSCVFGDKKPDHREYNIYLDDGPTCSNLQPCFWMRRRLWSDVRAAAANYPMLWIQPRRFDACIPSRRTTLPESTDLPSVSLHSHTGAGID